MIKGKPLQTNLLKGMESHLGVKQPGDNFKGNEQPDREQVNKSNGKTVFEMIDLESVRPPPFLPNKWKEVNEIEKIRVPIPPFLFLCLIVFPSHPPLPPKHPFHPRELLNRVRS